jgi:hypothetical protein
MMTMTTMMTKLGAGPASTGGGHDVDDVVLEDEQQRQGHRRVPVGTDALAKDPMVSRPHSPVMRSRFSG